MTSIRDHFIAQAKAQRAALGTYPSSASILRPALTNDGMGTQSLQWTTTASGVNVRLETYLRPHEGIEGGGLRAQTHFLIGVPDTIDVRPQDRIVIGAVAFEVVDTDATGDGTSYDGKHVCYCNRVNA